VSIGLYIIHKQVSHGRNQVSRSRGLDVDLGGGISISKNREGLSLL